MGGGGGMNLNSVFEGVRLKNVDLLPGNGTRNGINTYGMIVNLEETRISDSGSELFSFIGTNKIEKCTLDNASIKLNNFLGLKAANSRFQGGNIEPSLTFEHSIELNNVFNFNVRNNLFIWSNSNACFEANTTSLSENRVANNLITVSGEGVLSQGFQPGLKLLCNEYTSEINTYDGLLGPVDLLQGNEGPAISAAGNIFSSWTERIAGNSSSGTRYFFVDKPDEIPFPYTNSNIIAVETDEEAGCGIIGPGFQPKPTPKRDPCLFGIDCSEPCLSLIHI